jgi:hypothetical protein
VPWTQLDLRKVPLFYPGCRTEASRHCRGPVEPFVAFIHFLRNSGSGRASGLRARDKLAAAMRI